MDLLILGGELSWTPYSIKQTEGTPQILETSVSHSLAILGTMIKSRGDFDDKTKWQFY